MSSEQAEIVIDLLKALVLEIRGLRSDLAPTPVEMCETGWHDGIETEPTRWKCRKCGFMWQFPEPKA